MSNINSITSNTKDAIKRKSAYSLPDRPSDQGMKPEDIKRAFWQPIVDVTYSSLTEIDRVIDEINNIFANIYDSHIANKSNPHEVTKTQVGLGNCNNTADADKPVSTPQRTALDNHNADSTAHSAIRTSITSGLALKVNITDIKDNFTSTDTNKPLSAYRGKLLYDSLGVTDGKAELAIKSIALDSSTGILTITKTNGTTSTIDLPLEYMVEDGYYDSTTKNIVLELSGGTTIEIPAAALVNEYYGDESTVSLYTDTADGNKVKFKISDTYSEKIDSNTSARHSHSNKSILDLISVAFTTALKSTYDGYASSISTNASAISTEVTNRQSEITRVEGLINASGTVVYVDGSAVGTFNADEITAAMALFADEAEVAKGYTANGKIAKKIKDIEARLTALEV